MTALLDDAEVMARWEPRDASVPLMVLGRADKPQMRLLQALCHAADLDFDWPWDASFADLMRASPAGVLLIDQRSVDAWRVGRRSLNLARAAGRIGTWLERFAVLPIDLEHAFTSHGGKRAAIRDLEVLAWVVRGELSPLDVSTRRWNVCGTDGCWGGVTRVDDQNIGWCEECQK